MRRLIYILPYFFVFNGYTQDANKTFEFRYLTNDPAANGETDFKGSTEWMDTDQRVEFLKAYADYASFFFGDPHLNRKIVQQTEIDGVLNDVKPQPLTNYRKTILLDEWKAYGYKKGQDILKEKELDRWKSYTGVSIVNNELHLENGLVARKIDSLSWRFKVETVVKPEKNSSLLFALSDNEKKSISLVLKDDGIILVSANEEIKITKKITDWVKLEIEGDFTQKRFNLIIDGEMYQYYIPMADTTASCAVNLLLQSQGKVAIKDVLIFNHILTGTVTRPYYSEVVVDENFEEKRNVDGWQQLDFNDSAWETVDLPAVHGGVREKEEDYYLRKKVMLKDFERATLVIETIDPGGEVWVNDQVVAVIDSRHPVELDVTKYLKKDCENILAIKVKAYQMGNAMGHSPSDKNIGWFLGRAELQLTHRCMIKDVLVHTASIGDPAVQEHKIRIQYDGKFYFPATLRINYYPWFPKEEGERVATFIQDIQVRPHIVNEYEIKVPVFSPRLWDCHSPALYKVEVVLMDKDGNPVDDYVTTTGIRLIEQKNGDFYINGKTEMLNGAQVLGFRTPIETIAKYHRCAPVETIAEELLMIKKMDGNLLRMHVHSERDTADGINDPRYAELADQLGICLIWQTPAWIRTGEAWHVDFEGYPKYMEQVYNHPSIVIWEAGNHPNMFKEHDLVDAQDYIKLCYNIIANTDQSRFISPTTDWPHTPYSNNEGTFDYKGNKIKAVPEFNAELITRGSQDTYAGYGHEWSSIRKAPNSWAISCLSAKDKAYFNFEHEESTGQPNWALCKGKPWYLLQSYEWKYDEGSIGRKLATDEWKESQAWQAFSAWESMKKQVLFGYDGFSWCCLHGGANMGTYKKPLIDNLGHPKLAFYVNKMVFQDTWAGSNNVDVVYGPDDYISPVINHLGENRKVDLVIQLVSAEGKVLDKKVVKGIVLGQGHTFTRINSFRFKLVAEGIYAITYHVVDAK